MVSIQTIAVPGGWVAEVFERPTGQVVFTIAEEAAYRGKIEPGSPLAPEWQTLSRDIASRGRKTPSLPTRASPPFLTCGRWQDPA